MALVTFLSYFIMTLRIEAVQLITNVDKSVIIFIINLVEDPKLALKCPSKRRKER